MGKLLVFGITKKYMVLGEKIRKKTTFEGCNEPYKKWFWCPKKMWFMREECPFYNRNECNNYKRMCGII
ncbi:hypothetical protein A3I18_01640 [Candidatus Campbellbacteria bacterium RIFCSPLOWO2_02_FULL_35_11]|uniref:Uncharacterized protein n=2 Tax=Candidatus Campbelliibacteriota TaxID=1752727 RepID=A0A1F5EMB1_9BACT|nr:MAG: hypothetical protein A3E89_01695 [Candidatus Campbellbacteria bacterium RIFCSPHIGHO2_12_FULL_35_10]OGD69800.1 MAG: hypothetical protein A3I18_01640 [Candidatus Campbellbacteria bacterium RIFCSPLOWO2_02_FULL_35_11]